MQNARQCKLPLSSILHCSLKCYEPILNVITLYSYSEWVHSTLWVQAQIVIGNQVL